MRTTTAKQAAAAKAALDSGQSWKVVAKKYSVDNATKDNGGLLAGVTKGEEEQALDTAAFAAPANKVLGPIHGQFGYYVFEVTKIKASTQQTLAQATPLIKQILSGQSQSTAQTAVDKQAKAEWLKQDDVPQAVLDGRLQRVQGAEDHDHVRATGRAATAPPTAPAGDDDRHHVLDELQVAR